MTLRSQINSMIVALMALFLVVLSALEIDATRRSIREEIEASSRITLQLLGTVIADTEAQGGGVTPQILVEFLNRLGRVRANNIRLENLGGQVLYESPKSRYKEGRFAPLWFTDLVTPSVKPTQFRLGGGIVTVTPDPSRSVVDAWDDLKALLQVWVIFLLLSLGLIFVLAGRLIRPLQELARGFSQMERGEFHARLPQYSVTELNQLADGFNRMAVAVEESFALKKEAAEKARALDESRAITKLIQDHVEAERRALARELHDELGQAVTGIRTIAASIAQRAKERALDLHANAEAIVKISGDMYDSMHTLVRQLRPIALDNLGLTDALHELVSASRLRHPGLSIDLQLDDDLSGLPEDVNMTVYRLVQEALTNVVRHAHADHVYISVMRDHDKNALTLKIKDNGAGMDVDAIGPERMGVRGMRERVHGFGGVFQLQSALGEGVSIEASLPLHEGDGREK